MKSAIKKLTGRAVTVLAAAAVAACSVEEQKAPSLAGPSGFAQAITLSATPNELNRDGSSQATVTALVHNEDGRPVSGQRLSIDLAAPGGTQLSASDVTTGADGRAAFVVTAPPRTMVGDTIAVSVRAVTSDSANVPLPRTVLIRLTPSNPSAPVPSFTVTPESPTVTDPVTLDASATTDGGVPCSGCLFTWDFGDGTTGTGQVVQKIYETPGSKRVVLTVADASGAEGATFRTVNVAPLVPPTVTLSAAPNPPVINQQATFTATATTGTNRRIVAYEWGFGDGTTNTTSSPSATHTYATFGTYVVSVTAVDDRGQRGSASLSFSITGPGAPTAVLTVSPTGTRPPGSSTNFDASGSTVGAGATITEYTWVWGDGSDNTVTSAPQTTHVYSAAGTYVVRLTVRDNFGRTSTATATVTVATVP